MRRVLNSFCATLILIKVIVPVSGLAQGDESYTITDGRAVTLLESFRECDLCPEMIVIPAGSFMMGATAEESRNPFDFYGDDATGRVRGPDEINIIPNEHPRHRVEMDIPYAIGRNEVTYGEWMACVDAGGCSHSPDTEMLTMQGYVAVGPDHPVVNVSYLDISEYTVWLNAQVGADVYRLPTEAEWEYAARAGTETRFAQGDELTADQANFSRRATENVRQGEEMPHLVNRDVQVQVQELDAANTWGLRHMSGNVKEITLSCWSDAHLGLETDSAYLAHAMMKTDCERRVAKGGAHNTAMDRLRLASRTRPLEDRRRDTNGFRLIRQFSHTK